MKSKDDIASYLAEAHRKIDSSIVRIVRISSSVDDQLSEPIKLLEVNPDTPPSGIVPIVFGPDPDVPYPSVVVEVTPQEFENLRRGELCLPEGWTLGATLYEAAGGTSDGSR